MAQPESAEGISTLYDPIDKDAAEQHWSQVFRSRTAPLADIAPSMGRSSTVVGRWNVEIEAMERQVLAAKQLRNSHTLPCMVPSEVLVHIFQHLARAAPVGGTTLGNLGWAVVSHVCRHFRAVALAHGTLWSRLSISGNYTLWDTLLSRSRDALISIYGRMIPSRASRYIGSVLQHIARVQTLDIDQIPVPSRVEEGDHSLIHLLQAPASELRRLKLVTEHYYASDSVRPELGRDFLRAAPKLVYLDLLRIAMCWSISSPTNLRSLVLSEPREIKFSLDDILRGLQCMPALELLCLTFALPDGRSAVRVSLPHLRILVINDMDERCLSFWSSLILHPMCSVYVNITDLIEDDSTLRTLMQNHLAIPGRPSFRHISVENVDYNGDNINLAAHSDWDTMMQDASRDDSDHKHDVDQNPVLSVTYRAMFKTWILPSLIQIFPNEVIETLCLTGGSRQLPDHLAQILSHLSQISFLKLISTPFDDNETLMTYLCSLFQCQTELLGTGEAESGTYENVLPSLRILHLECIRFDLRRRSDGGSITVVDTLNNAFKRRRVAGLSNPTLKITGSELKESWVRAWKEWVDVEYDDSCYITAEDHVSGGESASDGEE
ncbi:unnamed protein product [Peniophora sp. CBMAI 1063]|nr:unnamed protein product [Peniophora sp. CBMAI 1063]